MASTPWKEIFSVLFYVLVLFRSLVIMATQKTYIKKTDEKDQKDEFCNHVTKIKIEKNTLESIVALPRKKADNFIHWIIRDKVWTILLLLAHQDWYSGLYDGLNEAHTFISPSRPHYLLLSSSCTKICTTGVHRGKYRHSS